MSKKTETPKQEQKQSDKQQSSSDSVSSELVGCSQQVASSSHELIAPITEGVRIKRIKNSTDMFLNIFTL